MLIDTAGEKAAAGAAAERIKSRLEICRKITEPLSRKQTNPPAYGEFKTK
jgi:hypothetical protein